MEQLGQQHRSSNWNRGYQKEPQHLGEKRHEYQDNVDARDNPGKDDYVTSWLAQSFPHRNRPPELGNGQPPSVAVREHRRDKRPRSPSEAGSASPPGDHRGKGYVFEKRPRHKTREDKYEYKDGPGQGRPQPRKRDKGDSKKRQKRQQNQRENDSALELHRHQHGFPKNHKHRRSVPKPAAQQDDSEPGDIETSPDRYKKPGGVRRSGRKSDPDKRFDREIREISEFFGHKTGYRIPESPQRRLLRILDDHGSSLDHSPIKRSASADIRHAERQASRHPDVSRNDRHTARTRSMSRSTDYFTWSASGSVRDPKDGQMSYSESDHQRPERRRTRGNRGTRPSEDRKNRLGVIQKEKYGSDSSPNCYAASPDRRVRHQPKTQRNTKENMTPEGYRSQHIHTQRPPVDAPRVRFKEDDAMNSWKSKPRMSSWPGGWFQIPPGHEALPWYGRVEESQSLTGTARPGDELQPSNLDMQYFPQMMPPTLGPVLEGSHSPETAIPQDAPNAPGCYFVGRSITPGNFGYMSLAHGDGLPSFYSGPRSHSTPQQFLYPVPSDDLHSRYFPPSGFDSYEPKPRIESKRLKRKIFVERLEQETVEALGPTQEEPNYIETASEGLMEAEIQQAQNFSQPIFNDPQVSPEAREWNMTEATVLPRITSGLLPPTHGFTLLAPPGTLAATQEAQVSWRQEETLPNIWQQFPNRL